MLFSTENILLVGSLLLICGVLVQKPGYRFGVPALLLFLLVGMLFGVDGVGLQFNNMLVAQFIGMVALCIILFSGGMGTRIADIRPVFWPGILLSTSGVLLTTLFTGLFVWWIAGFSWTNISFTLLASFLLAATMSSTDSASVFAILRSQKMHLKHNLRPLLELESGSNDPMAYLLTIVFIGMLGTEGMTITEILSNLAIQFLVGLAAGFSMGKIAHWTMNRLNLDNSSFYPILLLGFVFLTFAVTDLMLGNGYLAVYVAGIVVGNNRMAHRRETATFIDGMTWLFQIVMFLMLGLLVNPSEMFDYIGVAMLIGAFMILVGRPLSVILSLLPFRKIGFRSRIFISWVGLRGAVPIIFATYPVVAEMEGSNQLFNIVFFITIMSLIIQGTTIPYVARLLKLDAPLPQAGNSFGIELPEEVESSLTEVVVTSSMLTQGNTLSRMNLPPGKLVMMVKRGQTFLVPNGQLELLEGDHLLFISDNNQM